MKIKLNAKKITGFTAKFAAAVVVLAFLALHSINFFTYVFPPDQAYYAWLGFGLTGGGFIAYLIVFLWDADSDLKKWTSLAIAVVSGGGEILTALFGMQVEAWQKSGFALTEEDFSYMLLAVGLLALAHGVALATYMAGDKVIELFSDEDGDGIPNAIDKDYQRKPKPQQQPRQVPQPAPVRAYSLDELLVTLDQTPEEVRGMLKENNITNADEAWRSLRGHNVLPQDLTHKNFNRLFDELNPTNGSGQSHSQRH